MAPDPDAGEPGALETIVDAAAFFGDPLGGGNRKQVSTIFDITPVLDSSSGEVFVFFSRATDPVDPNRYRDRWAMSSRDDGATWAPPRNVTAACSLRGVGSFGNGHGMQTTTGRLIVPMCA